MASRRCLDTTSLVNESYVKLAGSKTLRIDDRRGFFAYASRVMRSVIVDLVRERMSQRRGGGAQHLGLTMTIADPGTADEPLRIHEALRELEGSSPGSRRLSRCATSEVSRDAEIAEILGVTVRTVGAPLGQSAPAAAGDARAVSEASLPHERWSDFSRLLDEALELPDVARTDWLTTQESRDPEAGAWLRRVLGHANAANAPEYLSARGSSVRPMTKCSRAPRSASIGSCAKLEPAEWAWSGSRSGPTASSTATSRSSCRTSTFSPVPCASASAASATSSRASTIRTSPYSTTQASPPTAGRISRWNMSMACRSRSGVASTAPTSTHDSNWMRQVMDAVEYAHARLVVHRDLKPSNVLVTAEGSVKLLDFGIAKMLAADDAVAESGTLTRIGHRMATPGYSAPEQVAGMTVTTRADVYALGVMLYELLCGQRPFADGHMASPQAVAEEQYVLVEQVVQNITN